MLLVLSVERKIQFYASQDLKTWQHLSDFGPLGSSAGIWEVPELLELRVEGTSESRWMLPGFQICGSVELNFTFDRQHQQHHPAPRGGVPENLGVAPIGFTDVQHGVARVARPRPPAVVAERQTLILMALPGVMPRERRHQRGRVTHPKAAGVLPVHHSPAAEGFDASLDRNR